MEHLQLARETSGDDQQWRFIGIWGKNRWEWLATHIANMYFNYTSIGFFDAMGHSSVDYIVNQTELQTLCATIDYVAKVCDMKKQGLCKSVKNMVIFDEENLNAQHNTMAQEAQVRLIRFSEVVAAGEGASHLQFRKCSENDYPIFSYTSGTTGDSKGVKLTHRNLFQSVYSATELKTTHHDSVLSYLPYPHSFEQFLTFYTVVYGLKIGFYSGDPLRLMEDCQMLKPAFFPSVPRLWNRIYAKISEGIKSATGCKGWLANKALETKLENNIRDGSLTHGCYDFLVFSKMQKMLGGNIRFLVTASAPIDKQVM